MNSEVFKGSDNSRYGNSNDKRWIAPAPIVLLSNLTLTTSSGKHMEDFSHAHVVSLMYKPITSAKDSDDLSFGFGWDCGKRREELTVNKNIAGKYHVRTTLKDVFKFVEHQEKDICGLSFNLTATRD